MSLRRSMNNWLMWMLLISMVMARLTAAQSAKRAATDTLFPWPRWNGMRTYGIGQDKFIDVDPDLIVFDDTTRTATVTFINPTTIPQTLWLAPECGGDGKLQPDDPLAATWHNQYYCATPWISGYPEYLPLAPHERRTLTLRLYPYPTLPDGRYIARLMINGIMQRSGHDETAIEYVKGPKRPRRPRTRWVATAPPVTLGTLIQADRSVLVLNERSRTATVTLTNPGASTTELWLTMDCPWFRLHYDTVGSYTHKSQYEMTWHLLVPNIVTWLSGYPQHLVLAPHERRTITIQLTPFFNIKDSTQYPAGSYYAQLRYVQTPVMTVQAHTDTTFVTPEGAVNIVVHQGNGGNTPLLTLSPLQYVRHADGTATACTIVQQPGLGLVATLHAELRRDDGRPSQRLSPWRVDSTIVVWEAKQYLRRADMRAPVAPDPVCLALPGVEPGHYQLILAVQPLGGEGKQQTLPVEVP